MRAREANEFSICSFDMKITDESRITETVCVVYNSYVSGKNVAKELFGNEPELYSFDDFDNDGKYEAFVLESHSTTNRYFWNGEKIIKTEISAKLGCLDYTRCGGFLIAQPFSNGTPCCIFGVENSEPYTHPMSGCGMMIRPNSSSNRMDVQTGIYVLYKSRYNASSPGGSHTWTPYFFNYDFEELESIPVTREYFSDRPDVQTKFDAIEAEAKAEGGKNGNAFLRGGTYLNINYTTPIFAEDENGNEIAAADRNHYKTFAILPDDVVLIDEGRGVYTASIKDK